MNPSVLFGENSGLQVGINHGSINSQVHIQNITTIRPLASSIYKSLFSASDQFAQVRNELGLLISVLNATEEHTPEFRPGDPRIADLNDALSRCHEVLQHLQRLKEHFDNVGPQTQVTWERMGWGVEELAEIRGKFSLQIQVLNLLNTNMLRSSHENVERMLMTFINEIQTGKRESAAMSTASTGSFSEDEQEAWRLLRKELQSIGITPVLFMEHREFILGTLQIHLTDSTEGLPNPSPSKPSPNEGEPRVDTKQHQHQVPNSRPERQNDGKRVQVLKDPPSDTLRLLYVGDPSRRSHVLGRMGLFIVTEALEDAPENITETPRYYMDRAKRTKSLEWYIEDMLPEVSGHIIDEFEDATLMRQKNGRSAVNIRFRNRPECHSWWEDKRYYVSSQEEWTLPDVAVVYVPDGSTYYTPLETQEALPIFLTRHKVPAIIIHDPLD